MTLSQSRRRFLQSTLGGSALLSAGLSVPTFLARSASALAAGGGNRQRVLVVVQLSGGNDGLNTVIPYADPAYQRNRIVLRIGAGQVLKVDGQVGLHPQMQGFSELLEEGRLGIVQGVGYPNPDRSHFRSMDIWHSAQPREPKPSSGWLGRSVDQLRQSAGPDVAALNLGSKSLPLALTSRLSAVPSVDSLDAFRLRTQGGAVPLSTLKQLDEAPRENASPLLDFLQRSSLTALESSQQLQESLADSRSGVDYPGFGLASNLRGIAQLIDAGLNTRIYYVSLDGFDTHANQLQAHAGLLSELSQSLTAFVRDLDQRGHLDRVLVLSFSEFGRRVKENASSGTDHGAAAPLFMLGGRVQPGLIGKHPSLTDLDSGDLKFHTDFRQVYAAVMDQWLGCNSRQVLGSDFDPAPVLKMA